MELAATQYDAADQAVPVILLLTTDILFVLSCEEDGQQQAFTLIQLDCVRRVKEPTLITLVWRDSIQYPIKLVRHYWPIQLKSFLSKVKNLKLL